MNTWDNKFEQTRKERIRIIELILEGRIELREGIQALGELLPMSEGAQPSYIAILWKAYNDQDNYPRGRAREHYAPELVRRLNTENISRIEEKREDLLEALRSWRAILG